MKAANDGGSRRVGDPATDPPATAIGGRARSAHQEGEERRVERQDARGDRGTQPSDEGEQEIRHQPPFTSAARSSAE